ncbi:MAG: Gfo/Idh/MocA family oxidoreductase [Planctomycetes bacterium]|nr:Gfo/Idh/MocA family oxidoreductase [Planctomycetota bacterium]
MSNQRAPTRRRFLGVAGASMLATRMGTAPSLRGRRAKVRLAVAGGGFGASHHWHEHPDCEVTAVTDLVEERRQRLSRAYRCDRVFPSLEDMLDRARDTFDAVAVFTDAPSHCTHTLMCMEAGKHVTSACPVALTLEDCAKIKATQERTGLVYMMHESSWYRQPCIAARELYRDGAFGRLAYSEVEYFHPGIGTRTNPLSRWRGTNSWRWGFPPMLYPTHSLGLLVGVTGERIVRVSCLGQKVGDDFPGGGDNAYDNPFDNEMALGHTNRGNICRFGVCWQIAAHGERGQWLGEKLSCFMPGSAGQPQARRGVDGGWEPWDVPDYWRTDRLPEPMRHDSGHGGSAAFLSCEFVDAIVQQRRPTCDVYESIAMTAPGIVAHRSALQGGALLDVPSFDP